MKVSTIAHSGIICSLTLISFFLVGVVHSQTPDYNKRALEAIDERFSQLEFDDDQTKANFKQWHVELISNLPLKEYSYSWMDHHIKNLDVIVEGFEGLEKLFKSSSDWPGGTNRYSNALKLADDNQLHRDEFDKEGFKAINIYLEETVIPTFIEVLRSQEKIAIYRSLLDESDRRSISLDQLFVEQEYKESISQLRAITSESKFTNSNVDQIRRNLLLNCWIMDNIYTAKQKQLDYFNEISELSIQQSIRKYLGVKRLNERTGINPDLYDLYMNCTDEVFTITWNPLSDIDGTIFLNAWGFMAGRDHCSSIRGQTSKNLKYKFSPENFIVLDVKM